MRLDGKAQAELVRTISVRRLTRQIGTVDSDLVAELDDALRLHLQL